MLEVVAVQTIKGAIASALHSPLFAGAAGVGIGSKLLGGVTQGPKRGLHWTINQFAIEVDVPNTEPAFAWLVIWLDAHPYSKTARRIAVSSDRRHYDEEEASGAKLLFTPATGVHVFKYKKSIIWLTRAKEEGQTKGDYGTTSKNKESFRIRMLGRSQKVVRALLEEARELSAKKNSRPNLFLSAGSHWASAGEIPQRPIESVIFPDGEGERLVEDMETFLKSRKWYNERGVPYRRGYLFFGPPGTGKSSAIIALANHLKKPLYVCNVGGFSNSDESLLELLSYVPAGAIVLFEDIDAAVVSRETDDEDNKSKQVLGITLSGLLNAFDGVAAAEGRIIVLTTNYPDRLDKALTRAGRVDHKTEFGYATPLQMENLFLRFYEGESELAKAFVNAVGFRTLTPATLQQHFMKYRNSPQVAVTKHDEIKQEEAPT